ncbi:MAG: hypothetical protein N2489_04660 [Clostridia bacterium]|nr:hypothetical protein [Clostridia bacterium]
MSDDFDRSLKQAMDILSKPEALKGMLDILGSSMGSQTPSQPQNEAPANKSLSAAPALDPANNTEFLSRAQDVLRVLSSNSDPRVNLLTALTPFLNGKRQRAVSDCVQFLRVYQLLPILLNNRNHKAK